MKLVTVFRAFNPMQAQVVRAQLDSAGLHPSVAHEIAALCTEGYSMAVGGIEVQVPENEAEDARALIATPAEE